jgi:mono/diheme cytochrome c family protein
MRYFVLGFLLLCVAVVSIAGFRGDTSRRPPIEIFPDMVRQPKLRPQAHNNFFPDQRSSQLPVPGTIARGTPYEDTPVNTGRVVGATNFINVIPIPVTESLLERGRNRYQINCVPCHGALGDGKEITTRYGMIPAGNFHDKRLIEMPDGQIFDTITHGKAPNMGAYGANVAVSDRWAIVAYIHALQRSQLASLDDVPPAFRSALKK